MAKAKEILKRTRGYVSQHKPTGKYILYGGLGVVAIAGTWFLIKALNKQKQRSLPPVNVDDELNRRYPFDNSDTAPVNRSLPAADNTSKKQADKIEPDTTPAQGAGTGVFLLKKGNRGPEVKQVQEALNARGEKLVADGIFGAKTEAALKRQLNTTTLDKDGFDKLVLNSNVSNTANTNTFDSNPSAIGFQLYNIFKDGPTMFHSVPKIDINEKVIPLLQRLKNTDDYTVASKAFKSQFPAGKKAVSLLSGMFDRFPSRSDKALLEIEFLRMKLKKNGDKWSLSGFSGPGIITIEPAIVWVNSKESKAVPPNTVLGNEVARRLNHILFENGGKLFMVAEKSIRYL